MSGLAHDTVEICKYVECGIVIHFIILYALARYGVCL